MTSRPVRYVATLAALVAPLVISEVASAQKRDVPRFRGGIALEGGAIVVPGSRSVGVGVVGLQAQLGVQVNHLIGLYVVPSVDGVVGKIGGLNLSAAALIDFTVLRGFVTFGLGPDFGYFAGVGSNTAGAGALYGARLRFAINPLIFVGADGARRKALVIGADARLLGGASAFSTSGSTASVDVGKFALSPFVYIGYQAF